MIGRRSQRPHPSVGLAGFTLLVAIALAGLAGCGGDQQKQSGSRMDGFDRAGAIEWGLDALVSADVSTRSAGAYRLGQPEVADAKALPAVVAALRNDPSVNVRCAAANALRCDPYAAGVADLCAALQNDADEAVRREAVVALAAHADPVAIPTFRRVLFNSRESRMLRIEIVDALARFKSSPETAPMLCEIAGDERTPRDLREKALDQMATLGNDAVPHFIRFVRDQDIGISIFDVDTLCENQPETAMAALVKAYRRHQQLERDGFALKALVLLEKDDRDLRR